MRKKCKARTTGNFLFALAGLSFRVGLWCSTQAESEPQGLLPLGVAVTFLAALNLPNETGLCAHQGHRQGQFWKGISSAMGGQFDKRTDRKFYFVMQRY